MEDHAGEPDAGRGTPDGPPDGAAESAHRIANNLTLLVGVVRLQRARLKRKGGGMSAGEAVGFLDDLASRIETVASLHRLLSMKPGTPTVDLAAHLGDLRDMLALALTLPAGGTVRLAPADYPCEVSAEQIVPLGLLVNEAVTNGVKYAHPTGLPVEITIGCRRGSDGGLVIEVADDGVGLPEGLDPQRGGGLGFQMMRLLARQLEAELGFESSPLGLRCTVTLPPPLPAIE